MANLQLIDEDHVRLYLGRSQVVLDIPQNLKSSYNPNDDLASPECSLQMEWVYGSRGKDCRNNVLYLTDKDELVYFMAAVVVLLNTKKNVQRHYVEHTDDIDSIALHPDKVTIATGQMAGHSKKEGKPHVRVWRSDNLQTLHVIGEGDLMRSVCCVAFSGDGQQMCVVDEADDHHLSVWDWNNTKKLCQAKASKDPILDVEFHPTDSNSIVSCGRGQIAFWNIKDNRTLESKRGIFKDKSAPKYILGLAFSPKGFLVSGDSNGNILIWDKGKITRELANAHSDAVFSLTFLRDGRLVSCGRGGHITLWDDTCTRKLVSVEVPTVYGAVRCATQGSTDKLYLETTKNCLLEGTFQDGFVALSVGHRDELWGLCVHPSDSKFVTCGDDRLVTMRDSQSYQTLWTSTVKQGAHCCSLSPDGQLLVVGCQTGHYIMMDASTGSVLHRQKLAREQLEDVKFSPDGKLIAIGSRDNNIYVMQVNNDKNIDKISTCQGHTSYVTHIDWSKDGKLLRSNSGDYELLFWKVPSGDREHGDCSDVTWYTHSCTLDFNVCGIWKDAKDGSDVNAVTATSDLCVSADDFGKVNLYKYPCSVSSPNCLSYTGHSSHVTNVAVIGNNTLITTGGRDMTVIQWKLN